MKVLVDTSVWSLAFRRISTTEPLHESVIRLDALLGKADIVLVSVVLQEVLQGFRDDRSFRKVARALDPFALLPLSHEDHSSAARLHRTCAAAGAAASTIDCLIASAAISHKCALLTADRDFERIARNSALRLVSY